MASLRAYLESIANRLQEYRRAYPGKYAALGQVARSMEAIPHMIVGGTAAFLNGLDLVPHDIDVVTTAEGAMEAHDRLKAFSVQPTTFRETSTYSSHFGMYKVNGVSVEIMGDLLVRRQGLQYRIPVTPLALAKATVLNCEGFRVVLAPVEDEVISAAVVEAGKHRDRLPHWLRVHLLDHRYLEARMLEMGIPPNLREVVRREINHEG